MPGPYVTAAGMTIPAVQELIQDMVDEQRATIDPLIDTDAEEVFGHMNGIVASALREAYEVCLVGYGAYDPAACEDARVDALCAITGSRRHQATKSKFTGTRELDVDLNAVTTLPLGTMFEVDGEPTKKFVTTEIITSTIAGLYKVAAEAQEAGRTVVNANTLTVVTTPVVGLNSVNNAFDAIVGTNADTDDEALARREDELATLGSGRPDALRAHLLDIEVEGDKPVLEATVFENDGDAVDALGLPGHSMEALVFDGLSADCPDDDIAQTIWDQKPGGTKMYGSSSGTAVDSLGASHTVAFSRPSQVGVDLDITINTDDTYAGSQAVYDAWKAYADGIRSGTAGEVKWSQAVKAILAVTGVTGVETVRLRRHLGTYLAAMTDLPLLAREKPFADATAAYCTITIA